ncbi:MAG: hypothetical protein JNN08_02595 [Bryobacterales bacterium]|nr:hypothetical protein [Bryobacterales bacterium]
MFTWICPQCGAEVPPSYNDCPQCAERKAQQQAAPAAAQPAAAAPPPQFAPPPPQAQPAPAPPQYGAGQPGVQYVYVKQGLPAWAVTLMVALGLVIIGGGLYYYVGNNRRPAVTTAQEQPVLETVKEGAKAPAAAPAASKFIEVTGIRIFEEARKPMVRFMVINHSQADLPGVSGTVLLKAAGKDDPIASIPLKLSGLGPYEGKDITAPLKTKLRAYEMPDWQFIKVETQLEAQ